MKIIYRIFAILLVLISFISCEKDNLAPNFSVVTTVDADNSNKITFTITGDAETFAIYTGDAGHEYDSSHFVLTDGIDVDLEERVLTTEGYNLMKDTVIVRIESYNDIIEDKADVAETPAEADSIRALKVDVDYVLDGIQALINKTYTNTLTAKYDMAKLMDNMMPENVDYLDEFVGYFDDNSTLLAPDGGFSMGAAIDRYDKKYTYTYPEAGTYKAVVIATNVSVKKYSGSGYKDNATSSASEYNYVRETKEVVITVQ